jgi:hypothetical protein
VALRVAAASAGRGASAESEGAELAVGVTALRAAVALGRHRLGTRLGGRLGLVGAVGVALVYGFAASTGANLAAESNSGLVAGCLRWATWLGAGPVALSAARVEGEGGLTALARLAGIAPPTEALGRSLAAAWAMVLRIAGPALLLCIAGAIRSPSPAWGALALGATGAAILLGAVLAALAIGCARVAPDRGRSLFLSAVLLPYLASRGTAEGWSLPGVLALVIDVLTGRFVP